MSKENGPGEALESAMADALAAVERIESEGESVEVEGEGDEGEGEGEGGERPSGQDEDGQAGPEVSEEEGVKEQLLRLAADFENFRKRAARQLQDTRLYGIEKVLLDLLPVMDNLDRALAHSEGEESPIVEGVRMVAKQFVDVLVAYGVKGFDSIGEPFDPERHEAMGQAPAGDQAPGTVLDEMLKGYHLHERLLRPAQVIVAAAPIDGDKKG